MEWSSAAAGSAVTCRSRVSSSRLGIHRGGIAGGVGAGGVGRGGEGGRGTKEISRTPSKYCVLMQARRGGEEGSSEATVWWLLRRGVGFFVELGDARLRGAQCWRTQVVARTNWLRGKRLDRSITNTAFLIGSHAHIIYLAVRRSESDEADRPRLRLSASVFVLLSALIALQRESLEAICSLFRTGSCPVRSASMRRPVAQHGGSQGVAGGFPRCDADVGGAVRGQRWRRLT